MNAAEAAVGHEHDHVALVTLGNDRPDDVVDIGDVARALSAAMEIVDEQLRRQPLGFRKTRPEHTGDDDLVRRIERTREVVLEYAPARRGGARLEDGPEPPRPVARTQCSQR